MYPHTLLAGGVGKELVCKNMQVVCVCVYQPSQELHLPSMMVWNGLVFAKLSLRSRHIVAGVVHSGIAERTCCIMTLAQRGRTEHN